MVFMLGMAVSAYAQLGTTVADAVDGMESELVEVGTDADDVIEDCGGAGTFEIVDANADGIPDYAQMALAEDLDGSAGDVRDALAALDTGIQAEVTLVTDADALDGFAYWLAIDNDNADYSDCFEDLISTTGNFSAELVAAIATGGADCDNGEADLAATGDPDADGRTNLEEWNWVRQGSGNAKASANDDADFLADVALFVDVATDATQNQDTFPVASGVPVSGGIGLGLLALGIAAGGALLIRRK
jgi:hypothetical protein